MYLVNGTVASNFTDKGFITQNNLDILSSGWKRRNLTLTSATIDLNNTNVRCRVSVLIPYKAVYSNTSILRLQGRLMNTKKGGYNVFVGTLAAVNILYYMMINSTSINITWSAPYTLDGVDILGYNITITNTSTGNILHTYFTQDTQYVISNKDGDPCTELTLTISGYNGAGKGDTKSFNYYHPKGTIYQNRKP